MDEGDVTTPGSASPVRRRMLAVALLVVLVASSGIVLQRVVGVRAAPAGSAEASVSGTWFCPHGGDDGWQGWVTVTNPGSSVVRVRLTTYGEQGVMARSAFPVRPTRQVVRSVPASEPGASTEVEFFGGWVGASVTIRSGTPIRTSFT